MDSDPKKKKQGELHRERSAKRAAAQSEEARDIGPIPEVVNPKRRERCSKNLELALKTYFPAAFPLPFSRDHKTVIQKIDQTISQRGLLGIGMPRGSGKTTLCECSLLLAMLYGRHSFGMLIGAEKDKSKESMARLKQELETNQLLLEDFPEVCYPIIQLEGIHNRVKGQLCQGESTRMVWTENTIVFPTVPGSKVGGAVLKTGSLLSAVRGANHRRAADGARIRPTLLLLDDPQTARSAKSWDQTNTRTRIVSADLLGLQGPDEQIAALMTCTVIEPDDLADRILDRAKNPDWRGERMKLIERFPNAAGMKLWEEYREIYADALARGASPEEAQAAATKFYRAHRKAMDSGAIVVWEARRAKGHLSALETAMCLYLRDPAAFASEYQNEPTRAASSADELLTTDQVARRVSALPRGRIPAKAQRLTVGVDVQQDLLYWVVCWWDDDFSGGVVDYGTWPKQRNDRFTAHTAQPTLRQATGKRSILAAVKAGLMQLTDELMARTWAGGNAVIERIAADAGWGQSTDTVYEFARESTHSRLIRPAHGKGIRAQDKPMSQWKVTAGEKAGHHWMRRLGKRGMRYLLVDTNYWKTTVSEALALPVDDPHGLSLFAGKPHELRQFAEHVTSEARTRVTKGSSTIDLWTPKPNQTENHWFDALVLAAVGASELGCSINKPGHSGLITDAQAKPAPKPAVIEPPTVSYLEL